MRPHRNGPPTAFDRVVDLVVNPERYVVALTVVAYLTGVAGVATAFAGAGSPTSTLTGVGIALMAVCLLSSFAAGMAMSGISDPGRSH